MEVESTWTLVVELDPPPSTTQITALRASCSSLSDIPASALLGRLRSEGRLAIGGLPYHEAVDILGKLRPLGMNVRLE